MKHLLQIRPRSRLVAKPVQRYSVHNEDTSNKSDFNQLVKVPSQLCATDDTSRIFNKSDFNQSVGLAAIKLTLLVL